MEKEREEIEQGVRSDLAHRRCPLEENGVGDLYAIRQFIDTRMHQIEGNMKDIASRVGETERLLETHAGELKNHNKKLNLIFGTTILTLLSIVGTLLTLGVQYFLGKS